MADGIGADERRSMWDSIKPYLEKESLAAFFVGVSSGFPYAMIGATLTTRLSQNGIEKSTITAFTLAFLVYNFKIFWAWIVDGVRLPVLGRLGQRVSWMLVAGVLVIAAVSSFAPFSATRPSAIIRSTSRRLATPARARSLAMRSPSGRSPSGRSPSRRSPAGRSA